jgi:2-C-methyl-D-erythritol 2,4-cyclodiphosphate synthase
MLRIGHGFDFHRYQNPDNLNPGETLRNYIYLGGVKIPHTCGIIAHSDGDVLIHALCDALLGAAALGDIGRHFPDNDLKYKNIDSKVLLKQVLVLLNNKTNNKVNINNIDITVIAQKPKLAEYHDKMRACLAEICQITLNQINIKATTTEGLEATGDGRAIAVHAVVLIQGDISSG